MPAAVSGTASLDAAFASHTGPRPPKLSQPDARETFQDFVAGTFYKQMLKALRKTHDKPAYFHGGQAEEAFRGQLDQQIAEDLARTTGAAFSDELFTAFIRNSPAG
jgi:Rod binding domain-containing protein